MRQNQRPSAPLRPVQHKPHNRLGVIQLFACVDYFHSRLPDHQAVLVESVDLLLVSLGYAAVGEELLVDIGGNSVVLAHVA